MKRRKIYQFVVRWLRVAERIDVQIVDVLGIASNRKNSENDRIRYDYIWVVAIFLELRSFKYLYPPRSHEELAVGDNKNQGYNKKFKLNKCDYHKFHILHGWGVCNTTLSRFGRGKARFWFSLKNDSRRNQQSQCKTRWNWNY